MEWSGSQQQGTDIYCTQIEERDWRKMANPLSQFWERFCLVCLEKCQQEKWNRILLEIWIDSGRIIAYPALEQRKVLFQVTISFLLELFEMLPDPVEDPVGFRDQAGLLELQVDTALLRGSMRDPGKAALQKLRAAKVFKVYVQSADNPATARFTSV
jgi:hypothetical protein